MQLKQDLPQARAGYDDISGQERSSCFSGTRKNLLTVIREWIDTTNMDKPIFVLDGIAGIGKTTVAQSTAAYAADKKLLGASFFFSRHEEERKSGLKFFSTLAFQLALYDAHLGAQIAAALLNVPGAPDKILAEQLKCLIVEPIQKAKLSKTPVILVIDALDECLPAHAEIILGLLASNIQYMINFKIFLTTRPEPHIRKVIQAKSHLQLFHLHEIEKSIAKGDIELFLKHALSKKQIFQSLQFRTEWEPTREDLKSLSDKCGILFIMASTAVKYVLDATLNEPALQMSHLLNGLDIEEGDMGVMSSLDKMYLGILRTSIPERKSAVYLQRFQKVVGAIVVLEDLLSISCLANLLDMEELHVKTTLQSLHSIMAPASSNQAPQLYHKSFPDFITDKKRCIDVKFYIIPEMHHAQVAQLCFSIMDKKLHANMPGLQGLQKYMTNTDMGGGSTKSITSELKYACIYWAAHLSKSGNSITEDLLKSLDTFAFTHLLHWIEVLSLIGKLEMAHTAIKDAQQVLVSGFFVLWIHGLKQEFRQITMWQRFQSLVKY